MPRKKQVLKPKVSPVDIKPPAEPPPNGIDRRDYYIGVALGALLSRSQGFISKESMLDIKKEANLWADLMLED